MTDTLVKVENVDKNFTIEWDALCEGDQRMILNFQTLNGNVKK